MAVAKVEQYNGMPAIIIDGKPYPPMMATIRTNNRTSMVIDEEYYRELGKSGIKIFFLICDTEWLKPGAFDMFCEEAEKLLANVPDAYIMLRVGMHPPVKWCEEHPDDLMRYSDGIRKPIQLWTESYVADYPAMYSLCSEQWRQDAGKALLEMWDKIRELPYSERIIGCFFAAGGTSEWYYMTPTEYTPKSNRFDSGGFEQVQDMDYDDIYGDLSGAFQKSFSNYLKNKYNNNDTLKKVWNDGEADIEKPKVPDCHARYFVNGVDYDIDHPQKLFANSDEPEAPANGTNIGSFLDIDKHMDVFDFYRAWHIGVAESVIYFGNIVKSMNPNLLTGAFYGSAGSNKVFSMGQIGGVTNILKSGKIDFLASPGVYENRQPGGFTGQRQVFDSFALHNCMFIVEEDARTHFENKYFAKYVQMFDMEDSVHVLKREFGRNICQNLQAWWFDQLLGGKRYKHPDIYKLFARQQQIAAETYEMDRRKNSEIAFIYDEESYHVVSEETTHQMVELFRNYEIDLIGAPADRYYHQDMADEKMPDYKLYVFVNTFYLTTEERQVIKRKLRKNHATALFLYASGLINPDADIKLAAANIENLTGFAMGCLDGVYSGMFKMNRNSDNSIVAHLDLGEIYGDFTRKMWANCSSYMNRIKTSRVNLYPCYYAEDANAENIAYFLDSGKPALSIREYDGFTSIYCGSKYLSAEMIREIARYAGCHIYCDTEDVLYVNRNYLTFHAASGGTKVVHLPKECDVYELYQEKYYGKQTNVITFDILKGETLMFWLK